MILIPNNYLYILVKINFDFDPCKKILDLLDY